MNIDATDLEKSIEAYVKDANGDGVIVTGWIVIASTLHTASGEPMNGYTYGSSIDMPQFVKLGLVETMSQNIRNEMNGDIQLG